MQNARKDYTPDDKVAARFPEYKPPKPAKRFDVLWAEFVDAKELAASPKKKWEPYFRQLIKRIGTDDMSRVTEQHLLDWRDALLASKASRRNVQFGYLAAVRAFFRWAKREKKLPTNPGAEVTNSAIMRGPHKPMLPGKPGRVRRVNDRCVLNGIFWVLRSVAPWRDLPENYGPRTTCYNRFVRWRRAGVWGHIMDALAAGHDAAVQMIDTSIVRVHQHGACTVNNNQEKMGRSRGGLRSKIHAVVDTNGLPVHLALTPGEAHDNRLCSALLSALLPKTMLLAGRGHEADWIRKLARLQGAWANIPPKRNRKDPTCFSPYLYRACNLIERSFNKIKQCRRVATRYDKLAANYLAFVKLASIRIWLRANGSTP